MKKNKLKRTIAKWMLIKIFESEDDLISWGIGTKFDTWDITVKRNRYPIAELNDADHDGCNGCAFEDTEEWEMPCCKCKQGCKDYYRRPKEEKVK